MDATVRDNIVWSYFLSGSAPSFKRDILNNPNIHTSDEAYKLALRLARTNDVLLKDEVHSPSSIKHVNNVFALDQQDADLENIKASLKKQEVREAEQIEKEQRQRDWREHDGREWMDDRQNLQTDYKQSRNRNHNRGPQYQ